MQRIMVIGASGSGKSSLARLIGERCALPVVHLDRIFHGPGWTEPPKDVWRTRVAEVASADAWVMDGAYASTFDLRLPRAQCVIWLDLPRRIYFTRTVCRMLRYWGRNRPDTAPGCPERFDPAFFKDWVWAYPSRRQRDAVLMAGLPAHLTGITLRSPAEVRQFVAGLPASLNPPGSAR